MTLHGGVGVLEGRTEMGEVGFNSSRTMGSIMPGGSGWGLRNLIMKTVKAGEA